MTAFSKLFSIFKPKQSVPSKPPHPPPPPGTTATSSSQHGTTVSSHGTSHNIGDVNLAREYDGGQGLDGDELGLGMVGGPPSGKNNMSPR